MKNKIKIGILINSDNIPSWSHKMLEKIRDNYNLEIVVAIRDFRNDKKAKLEYKNLWKEKDRILWELYSKYENKVFKMDPNAFELKDIGSLIKCETVRMHSKEIDGISYFETEDTNMLRSYKLDVLINLCFNKLSGSILEIPNYGIWTYRPGDRKTNRGGPPGAWEVFKGQDKTGITVEIQYMNFHFDLRLASSYAGTERLSINRTNNNSYWKGLSIIPRKLEELHRLGGDLFFKKILEENTAPEFFDNRILYSPANMEVLFAVCKIYFKKLISTIKSSFYFSQWILLFKFEKESKWSTNFQEFQRIVPPKDRFWADPFIWVRNDRYYIFFEELIYRENVGKIAVMEIDDEGNYQAPKIILDKPYHMSYPFLIEDNSELYMIPETSGNRTIELYKCIDFPLKWELHKVLMKDIYAVDSTILKHEDKYWLFCNIRENEGASSFDELFLFYSETLFDNDWKSHPCNPIISDVSQARPAGNIFKSNGKLFRPSQNSAKGYGHGMKINEIITMNTIAYHEKTIQSLYPNWEKDLFSTHTLNNNCKLTVIDALVNTRR